MRVTMMGYLFDFGSRLGVRISYVIIEGCNVRIEIESIWTLYV